VAPVLRQRGASPADLVVVSDDADLPLGSLRIRRKGSSGGHRGLKSIAAALGTDEFERVRLGIGRGGTERDLVEHVLAAFSAAEWAQAREMVARAADAVLVVLEQGAEKAMNQFNVRTGEAGSGNGSAGGKQT
jgi:PTH1 family peptidyl-tRNA hydrolase